MPLPTTGGMPNGTTLFDNSLTIKNGSDKMIELNPNGNITADGNITNKSTDFMIGSNGGRD